MAKRLPPLVGLRTFVTAARAGSFLKASEELCVTPAAVSRSIRSLEDHLGCRLFHRSNRQISLSEEGQFFLAGLGDVFDRIALASENLAARRASRPLVVCAYPSFITDWLIPRWSRQHRSHDELPVKFVTTHSHDVDLEARGIDIVVFSDRPTYRNCICEWLFTANLVAICAPNYLAPDVQVQDLDDWQGGLLHSATRPGDWARWAAVNDCPQLNTTRGHVFESSILMHEAVIAGMGIAVGIKEVLSRQFAANSLVEAFRGARHAECPYYLIYLETTTQHPGFAAFRDWIHAEARR